MDNLMSEFIDKISSDLLEAQKVMGKALKDSNNPFFKSKYADINSVLDAVIPALNQNNISVWQPTVVVDGRKYVKTMFVHAPTGQFIAGLTEIVYVKELDPQQQVAAITYARRGGLQSMANIGGEDDDGMTASGKETKADKPSRFARKSNDTATAKKIEATDTVKPPEPSQDSSGEVSDTKVDQPQEAPTKTSFRRLRRS